MERLKLLRQWLWCPQMLGRLAVLLPMARKPREKIEVVETHVGEPALLMGWPKRTGVVSEDMVALHPCRSGCPAAESERSGVGAPF
jgi:hypothetical protein